MGSIITDAFPSMHGYEDKLLGVFGAKIPFFSSFYLSSKYQRQCMYKKT